MSHKFNSTILFNGTFLFWLNYGKDGSHFSVDFDDDYQESQDENHDESVVFNEFLLVKGSGVSTIPDWGKRWNQSTSSYC